MHLNVRKDPETKQFHWNVSGNNNEIMATAGSEWYKQKAKMIKTLRKLFGEHPVLRHQIDLVAQRGYKFDET